MSKLKESEEFLNRLRRIVLQNPSVKLDYKTIYWELANYNSNISEDNIVKDNYFNRWIQNFNKMSDINVFISPKWKYFCQFTNGNISRNGDFLKLYINLNETHIYEGVNKIFTFLQKEKMIHLSKVASDLRSDGLVIRLKGDDIESAKKICEFVHSEPYIRYGSNEVNPFLPNIGLVGIMKDDGGSYNSDLSKVIASYLIEKNLTQPIKIQEFLQYATTKFISMGKPLWAQNLLLAYDANFSLDIFKENIVVNENVIDIIENAIIETYNKYGKNHCIRAIQEALIGNYNFFPRESLDGKKEIRSGLIDKVSIEDIESYVSRLVNVEGHINADIISSFFDKILYKHKGIIFDNALKVTVEKYQNNYQSVLKRITKYMYEGHAQEFTSYGLDQDRSFNYRQSIVDNIEPKQVMDIIKSILESKGIEHNKMNDNQILDEYTISILRELGLSTSRN